VGTSIVVADPLTLKLILERPAGYFLAALSYPTSWAVPKQLIDTYADRWTDHLADKEGFGGNLFTLTSWQHPGAAPSPDGLAHLNFERNERFWGKRPLLRRIEYTIYKGTAVAWSDFKLGKGDVGFPAGYDITTITHEITEARALKGVTSHQTPELACSFLATNWKLAPFDDIRVRQAFSLALDRQAIAHDALQDLSEPTIHLIPEGLPGYNSDLADAAGRRGKDALTPDLTTARKLATGYATEKCGGSFAKCTPIYFAVQRNRATLQRANEMMASQWQAAFPGWMITPGEFPRLQIRSTRSLQLAAEGWGEDYPDPQDFVSLLWTTRADYNQSFINIPDVDALCAQADGMSDLSARIPLYQQAEQQLVTQGAAIPYAQPIRTYVVRAHVVGWQIAPTDKTPLSVWQTAYIRR
jgi:oligopeptide transport system substrate-binding protein